MNSRPSLLTESCLQPVVQKMIRLPSRVTCSLCLAAFATEYLAIKGSEREAINFNGRNFSL